MDTLYEIPAGRLELGEAPRDCALRELKEETGCTAEQLDYLLTMYTTPGFTDEKIHIYMATGLVAGETKHEADEFLDLHPMRLSRALEMIEVGEIPGWENRAWSAVRRRVPRRSLTLRAKLASNQ
jgi:ADP-ribose pyrophosphatase